MYDCGGCAPTKAIKRQTQFLRTPHLPWDRQGHNCSPRQPRGCRVPRCSGLRRHGAWRGWHGLRPVLRQHSRRHTRHRRSSCSCSTKQAALYSKAARPQHWLSDVYVVVLNQRVHKTASRPERRTSMAGQPMGADKHLGNMPVHHRCRRSTESRRYGATASYQLQGHHSQQHAGS